MKATLGRIEVAVKTEREAREIVLAKLLDQKGEEFVDMIKVECAPHFCKDESKQSGISLGWLCLISYKTTREYRKHMAAKEVIAA